MRVLAPLLALALLGSACSGDDDGAFGGASEHSACRLLERLADSAGGVEKADVSDPDAFQDALGDAVLEYATALDALRKAVPDDLRADVDALRAAAEQYRFEDGFEARANLDQWAERTCGAATGTTTTATAG